MEREVELERLTEAFEEKERIWSERIKREEVARQSAEKRADDLKVVVERLAMAGGDGDSLSPAAALAGETRQGGKSYTQFYTDYTIQEGKLRNAENEVVRLTRLLDEISQDISEKVAMSCVVGVGTKLTETETAIGRTSCRTRTRN